ncbi:MULTISPECIES: citrate transporter [Dethiosulfovibrio]|jgi:CitMHS family citrate-Mg2+:H+ or citrate-Ca2+:H+ symporter|uniref:Citrate transporter n=2 Tax=Dethiosulfovibrio TaxID=47054 RepID=A0ABS9ENR3_9BACT|nr:MULTISPECIES: citrate transporter [Dethiosulfovibrio]MCF4114603.1 citrate transporter [Dethiosulfovibrio russensis]MCF4142827.1 citrate transporter [Dethiosulfovibrio marinus]MCF4144844.1 citrate transporter [Dethiosulfovibrio acidaminovorans]MEA3283867.1 citrate transporter [Synergistota bacterium]
MYAETSMVLAVMAVVFALCSWKLKSPEISMVITAIAGALAGRLWFPVRLLVEGTFTYFDVGLIFITASVFINMYSATGAMNALVRKMVERFYHRKWMLFSILAVIMLIPGALTGAGSVSMFVVGGMIATVLRYMGITSVRTTAFIYVTSMLAAAAPPINLWAMLMAAQANMPYVGFSVPLLAPILVITVFTVVYLLRGGEPEPKEKILEELPIPPEGMNWFRILAPMLTFLVIVLLSKYMAFSVPTVGLPLNFLISAGVAVLCSPIKRSVKEWGDTVLETMEQVFPLLATVISVGVLVNIMTATGVRGLIAITFVTLPTIFIYLTALFVLPMAQGSLSYGSAIILGTPMIFLFNSVGFNVTIVATALSLMFPLGDCLPPSRISGRVAIEVSGYEGSYMSFLKGIFVPALFMGLVALFMLINANAFKFLVIR